jgi:hypothetical protein
MGAAAAPSSSSSARSETGRRGKQTEQNEESLEASVAKKPFARRNGEQKKDSGGRPAESCVGEALGALAGRRLKRSD